MGIKWVGVDLKKLQEVPLKNSTFSSKTCLENFEKFTRRLEKVLISFNKTGPTQQTFTCS